MDTLGVSLRIEQLVDHLRADRGEAMSLGDVASVTEVLLSTMKRYFNSVDTAIYGEFRSLSDHIQQARSEISQLRPTDLKEKKIPRAGKELEAIVQATEAATGTIMDAAEEIMSADTTDPDAYQQAVTDACMRIFEACSFQDITGQRITKVVSTLTHIEDRLNKLQSAWGPGIVEQDAPEADPDEDDEEYDLLQGPALDGEGILQNEVDNLMGGMSRTAVDPFDGLASEDDADEPTGEDDAPLAAAGDDDLDAVAEDAGADAEDSIELADDFDLAVEAAVEAAVEDAADVEEEGAPPPAEVVTPAPAPAKPAPAKPATAKAAPAKTAAPKPAAKKAAAPKPSAPASSSAASSQADIDALFD